jgi:predicted membrane protein (TIGR00267 family)
VSKSSPEDESNSNQGITSRVNSYFEEIGTYLRVTKAQKILRRYFAMNAFDGAMTSLGVVIGAYISDILDPQAVIGVILVGGLAMAVSGFSGTYLTESAERNHSLNELENAMLVNLDDTIYGKASKYVSIIAALVDGSAPFLASIPSVIPFYLTSIGVLNIMTAFIMSVTASLATLFSLGVYLGRLSGSNVIISGLKMVVAGILVAALAIVLNGE